MGWLSRRHLARWCRPYGGTVRVKRSGVRRSLDSFSAGGGGYHFPSQRKMLGASHRLARGRHLQIFRQCLWRWLIPGKNISEVTDYYIAWRGPHGYGVRDKYI